MDAWDLQSRRLVQQGLSVACQHMPLSPFMYVNEKKKKFTNSPCPSFLSEKKRICTSKETGIDQCDQMKYKVYLLYMMFYSEWKMAFQINEEQTI